MTICRVATSKLSIAAAASLLATAMVGCNRDDSRVSPALTEPEVAARPAGYSVVEVADGATIRGTIRTAGRAPARVPLTVDHDMGVCGQREILSESLLVSQNGSVRNAVVWLENTTEGKVWPEGEVVLDQKQCVYRPHVLVVGTDQPIRFTNADAVIHNVNTFPRENPALNFSLLPKGEGRPVSKSLKFPDEIKVTCDSHKWMSAWIVVRDNPYFAITREDGSFEIEQIPAGTYKMVVWHETLERVEKTVQLGVGETHTEDLQLRSR